MGRSLLLLICVSLSLTSCVRGNDVCIYGGSSACATAAYSAAKLGSNVTVICPDVTIGGMTTGGLGQTDIGNKQAVVGLSRQFYRKLGTHYGKLEQWVFEPHVAEEILMEYLDNPKIKVIGVEPENAACMKASLEAGKVVTLPAVSTIADGTAVKTPGDKIFPYIQQNIDDIITVPDEELIVCFLDMIENHKMVVENSGLLTVAALKHLDVKGKKIVSILSGGNMDVITMSSVVQNGLIQRSRIFTVSVLLPDKPGQLLKVAGIIAELGGNVIRLDHNQFVSINRNAAVELRITMEAFGPEHKEEILKALEEAGLRPKIVKPQL